MVHVHRDIEWMNEWLNDEWVDTHIWLIGLSFLLVANVQSLDIVVLFSTGCLLLIFNHCINGIEIYKCLLRDWHNSALEMFKEENKYLNSPYWNLGNNFGEKICILILNILWILLFFPKEKYVLVFFIEKCETFRMAIQLFTPCPWHCKL